MSFNYLNYKYCKFGNFRDISISANSVKTHICDVKNLRQRRDLPISLNERVISPIRVFFAKFRICEVSRKYNPREIFRIYSICTCIIRTMAAVVGVVIVALSISSHEQTQSNQLCFFLIL